MDLLLIILPIICLILFGIIIYLLQRNNKHKYNLEIERSEVENLNKNLELSNNSLTACNEDKNELIKQFKTSTAIIDKKQDYIKALESKICKQKVEIKNLVSLNIFSKVNRTFGNETVKFIYKNNELIHIYYVENSKRVYLMKNKNWL